MDVLSKKGFVIGVLHLPPFLGSARPGAKPMSYIEQFALANMEIFKEGDFDGVMLQDGCMSGPTPPETIAGLTAVGRLLRTRFDTPLGITINSHAPQESLAIAQAIGANFVRLKVFVGAMIKSEGLLQGCAYEALQYRARIQAPEIKIIADVHDRSGVALGDVSLEEAAGQAARSADALVLTGKDWQESLDFHRRIRATNPKIPLVLGGGATADNIAEVLSIADGVIVSTWLMKKQQKPDDLIHWDLDKIKALMKAARSAK